MLKAGGGQGGYRDHVEAYGYFFGRRGVNGSGGGRVIVLRRGNYTNNGSIILTGGAGGAGGRGWDAHGDHSSCDGYDGSPGATGSVQIEQL